MKQEYDPDKLFPVDVKEKVDCYLTLEAQITLNTKNKNLSINKRARKELGVLETPKSKIRFLCDGFKIYIDSMVGESDKNYLRISNANVGNSRALCEELKKHYELTDNIKATFTLVEVEKWRFRLELKCVGPPRKKKTLDSK